MPGTDTAVMLALAHVLVTEGLHDTEFLDRYCVGADRLIAYVLGDADGVAEDAGVGGGDLRHPARHDPRARAPHGRAAARWSR